MGCNESAHPSIGLVVLNYNNSSETISFLDGLGSIRALDAIQVVDNCSTDGSGEQLQRYSETSTDARLRFSQTSSNSGYGCGNNYGARELIASNDVDYLIISNPDVLFDESVVLGMASFLTEKSSYAAVAPVMKKPTGEICQSGWKLPTRGLFLADVRRCFLPVLPDPYDYGIKWEEAEEPVQVEVLPGSLFMIRTGVFESIGGFDEDTFLYGEENLLFAKVRQLGYSCAVLPRLSYVHAHGTSITKEVSSVRKRYRMLLDSNVIYARKVLGASRGWLALYSVLYKASIDVFVLEIAVSHALGKKR